MGGVKLSEVGELLEDLEYPVTHEEVLEQLGDVTLLLADGETKVETVVSEMGDEEFETPTDLKEGLYANLPTEAVGEPGQSEGDA